MSKWKKIKIVSLIIIVITLFVVLFVNNRKSIDGISESQINETNNKLNMDDDFVKIIKITAERNGDWSKLPLSINFRNKYNSQYGFLGKNDEYTYLSSDTYDSDKINQIVVLNVDHNFKQEQYYIHYTVNEQHELDDVEIVDKKLLYDENGNEVIYKNNSSIGAIISLCAPYRLEYDPLKYYNVTENFMKKWSGGFIPQQAIQGVLDIPELNDEGNNIVYLESDYPELDESESYIIGEGTKRYFKVHYFVDDRMYLDDVEVEEVSKAEIDRLLANIKE